MQIESNKSNNIKYFSSDEDSIIEKEIEKAAKDNFPFFKEINEDKIWNRGTGCPDGAGVHGTPKGIPKPLPLGRCFRQFFQLCR